MRSTPARRPAGTSAGSSRRRSSIVERDGGYAGLSDVAIDVRTDDHEAPLTELRRLYEAHQAIFGATPRDEWIPVDEVLAAELGKRLAALGFTGDLPEALDAWAGNANLELRVDGADAVDPVVLEELRSRT